MIKERPILFSGPMVRAILEGRKTQTRRIVKEKHLRWLPDFLDGKWNQKLPPYGKPGDQLWVRETHYVERAASTGETGFILYKATDLDAPVSKWRPSIHMPRWASRITLEVESVRVERLQDITSDGVIAEGVGKPVGMKLLYGSVTEQWNIDREFRPLWGSINGPGSWDANPWVWVVTFKRIAP